MQEDYPTTITPVLAVHGVDAAVAFYQRAFGAREIHRTPPAGRRLVAELAVGRARFRVTEESPDGADPGPQSLHGTTVRLNLLVADPDRVFRRAVENGAAQVAPPADQEYGLRQGRLADPFGHHWLIGRPLPGPEGDWARPPDRPPTTLGS